MITSTTSLNKQSKQKPIRVWAILVWLLIWQAGSMYIGQEILLVSPVSVMQRLADLIITSTFWSIVSFSFFRITAGFIIGILIGILMAGLASKFIRLRELLAPFMLTIRTIPVASFIILVLIWVSSRNLSILISFLMVLPIIYNNILSGIQTTDPLMIEMADVFQIPTHRRIRYIYMSQVLPFLTAGCSTALGLCWKAGVAAEVIGIPDGSIGEKLYKAKIYLNTPDLFAWTLVIILISIFFERLFLGLIRYLVLRVERM